MKSHKKKREESQVAIHLTAAKNEGIHSLSPTQRAGKGQTIQDSSYVKLCLEIDKKPLEVLFKE